MTDKAKRKGNPRRRLLVKIIVAITLIIALSMVAWRELQPTGAQIVFIAPDDDGIDQVWLAKLNNPEHPRQITKFEHQSRIPILQTAQAKPIIFFVTVTDSDNDLIFNLWIYNLNNDQLHTPFSCQSSHPRVCTNWQLHPNGNQIVYFWSENWAQHTSIYTYDLETNENYSVATFDSTEQFVGRQINWVDNTTKVIASYTNTLDGSNGFIEFDLSLNRQTFIENTHVFCQYLSPSGEHCAYNISDGSDPIAPELVGIYSISSNDEELIFPSDWQERPTWQNLSTVTSYFLGWHPDSRHFLMTDFVPAIVDDDEQIDAVENVITNLNLFDLETSTYETLRTSRTRWDGYSIGDFNYDGSKIVISEYLSSHEYQIILFNLETGEETPLPLFGTQPQWVNGGR